MLVVRPGGPADMAATMELARLSGRGFTSLPEHEDVLRERLELSQASFASTIAPTEAWYTLFLEDSESGEVAGIASVRASVGVARPHFSFRVVTLAQHSPSVQTRFDHQALVLVNECGGWTEVGSLFIRADRRGGGAGGLLAQSRYMLIASDPLRFAQTVMAELRGWFSEQGESPFWNGVSSKFFRLPFEDADRMLTATDGQFVLDLAPRHPIYVELIEAEAREAIGRVHREGEPALAMLEKEGFERTGLIDIFDGGPTMSCPRDSLRTVRQTENRKLRIGSDLEGDRLLLANGSVADFRATQAHCLLDGDHAVLDAETADALKLGKGDQLKVRLS